MKDWRALIIIGVLSALHVACSGQSEWTREERLNFQHFINAQKSAAAAVRLSGSGMQGSASASGTSSETLQLMRKALGEAQTVRDDVLAKAHPDLPEHFRNELQRGLQLQIKSRETGDASAETEGSGLHYRWIYWINSHNSEIKIPK